MSPWMRADAAAGTSPAVLALSATTTLIMDICLCDGLCMAVEAALIWLAAENLVRGLTLAFWKLLTGPNTLGCDVGMWECDMAGLQRLSKQGSALKSEVHPLPERMSKD